MLSCVYRTYQEGDEPCLEALLRIPFHSFRHPNYWNWKYKLNPNFDPALILIAEKEKKLIGCNHWSKRYVKISENACLIAVLAADVAVDPAYRGLGVGKELVRHFRALGVFKEKGILFSYMFTKPTLYKGLYQPAAGYFKLPTSTITYKKLFNCNQLTEKFEEINQNLQSNKQAKNQLEHLNAEISFKLRGSPEFTIKLCSSGLCLHEGMSQNANIVIEGNLPLSASILDNEMTVWDFVAAWLTRKIKIKGLLTHPILLTHLTIIMSVM